MPTETEQHVKIRRATLDDSQAIVDFNQLMASETEDKTLDHPTITAGVKAALEDEARAKYFVAESNGRVIGQTMVTLEWSDWRNGFFWWIQSVYVAPDWRRRGVFRGLYKHVRDEARKSPDVCGLRLYVHHENANAIRTYEDLGMIVTDYKLCEECW